MPLSTDVNLPRSHKARYPSRCVRCGEDPAEGTIRLWTHSIGWWTWLLWMFGGGFTTHPPACRSCGWKIRFERIGGFAITIVVALVVILYIWPQFDDLVARQFRKWAAMVLVIVCLIPYFAWQLFCPPCIDITAYAKSVDYEFRDADYAYEFAELNDDASWVKIE